MSLSFVYEGAPFLFPAAVLPCLVLVLTAMSLCPTPTKTTGQDVCLAGKPGIRLILNHVSSADYERSASTKTGANCVETASWTLVEKPTLPAKNVKAPKRKPGSKSLQVKSTVGPIVKRNSPVLPNVKSYFNERTHPSYHLRPLNLYPWWLADSI